MRHVEFLGVPGSGKSTLARALTDSSGSGGRLRSLDEAARLGLGRSSRDRLTRFFARRARSAESRMWKAMYARAPDRVRAVAGFVTRWPEYVETVVGAQRRRADRDSDQERVLRWIFELGAKFQVASGALGDDDVLVIDEGFAQRAVAVFGHGWRPDEEADLARYVASTPRPDLVFVVDVPLEVCRERLDRSGWPARIAAQADPNTKNLLVGTQQGRQIYEVDRHDIGAEPLRVIDASRTGLQYISGLAAVDVGGTTHYWVTDRRSDCSALDGLLMELSAGPVSNRSPTLAAIPDKTVVSGQTLSFTAVASDPDPGQSLTFSLVGAPAGATIGRTSGVFSWVASGSPRELEFKVRVTDNGSPQLSAERTVRVTVVAPNQPPVLLPIPDQTVVSGEELSFTAVASDPDPGQSLSFSLVGAPAGATIGRTSGVFSWVASGSPRELEFKVRVTDNGSPQLSAERTVRVTVELQPEEPPEGPDDPGDPPGEPGGPDTPPPGDGGGGGSTPPGGGGGGDGSNPPGGGGGSTPPSDPGKPGAPKPPTKPPAKPQDPGQEPTGPTVRSDFSDTNGHVFEADIEWLAAEGITRGCNPPINDRFCPDDYVTRGQMAAFLVRALGYTDDGGGNEFVDDNGSVFEGDIDRLATAGVTRGCNPPTNSRFCPDDRVTRGQMAAFLVRALNLTGSDAGDRFGDDEGHVFESDIELLAAAGVTRGCNPPTNSRFCPDDYVTRGQMAAFLHRALGE